MALDVDTLEASEVYLNSAILNGELISLDDNSADVLFSLQKASEAQWEDTISGSIPYSGTLTESQSLSEPDEFSYTAVDIEPSTEYEFRALAESATEVSQGEIKTFSTVQMQDIYTSPDMVDFVFNGTRDNPQNLNGKEHLAAHNIALRHVDPMINTKLSQRFDVPFEAYPDTPSIITDISTKLTVYYFVNFPGGGSDQASYIAELKNQAEEMLEGLANGDMSLHDNPQDVDFEFKQLASDSMYEHFLFVGHMEPPDAYTEFGNTSKVFDNRS